MIRLDEKHLEDIFFSNLETEVGTEMLHKRGFHSPYKKFQQLYRQLNLGPFGITDIIKVTMSKYAIDVTIIELKVTEFDIKFLFQLGRYMTGVKEILRASGLIMKVNIHGIIVCSGFDEKKEYGWIKDVLDSNISIYKTLFNISGVTFENIKASAENIPSKICGVSKFVDVSELKTLYKKAYNSEEVITKATPF